MPPENAVVAIPTRHRITTSGRLRALAVIAGLFGATATAAAVVAPPASAACLLCINFNPNPSPPPPGPTPAPVPVPTVPPAPLTVGVNDHAGHGDVFPSPLFREFMVDVGAQLDRWPVDWGWYEPSPGSFRPGYLNYLAEDYDAALARGIRPVVEIFGSPRWALDPWARGPQGGIPCRDTTASCAAPPNVRSSGVRAAWMRFVQTVAARFPQAAAIEIWNEPNLNWAWRIKQDPALYARMLSSAKEALVAVGSRIPVLTGGLSSVASSDDYNTSLERMLSVIYEQAGPTAFDAIAYHSYPCASDADPSTALQQTLERVRRVKNVYRDLNRPLWITETGAASATSPYVNCGIGFTEASQGPALSDVFSWARSTQATAGDVPVMLVNSLLNDRPRDNIDVPHSDGRYEYGVVAWSANGEGGSALRLKPAYTSLRCSFRQDC